MRPLELDACDNLLTTKVSQAYHANHHRSSAPPFQPSEHVYLSTTHRCHEYKNKSDLHSALLMPRFDGPYTITATDPRHSTVMLDLPSHNNMFPVFHTSKLKHFHKNSHGQQPAGILRQPLTR